MKYQAIKTMYKCQRGPRVTRTPILGLSNHIPALKWIIFILGNKSLCKEDYLSNCEHSWLWTQPNKSKHVKFENFLYQSSLKKKKFSSRLIFWHIFQFSRPFHVEYNRPTFFIYFVISNLSVSWLYLWGHMFREVFVHFSAARGGKGREERLDWLQYRNPDMMKMFET